MDGSVVIPRICPEDKSGLITCMTFPCVKDDGIAAGDDAEFLAAIAVRLLRILIGRTSFSIENTALKTVHFDNKYRSIAKVATLK